MTDLGLHDLDFDLAAVECLSPGGTRYTRWLRTGMPKIPQRVIDSAFFLYRTKEDALVGKNPGGSGFVVSTGLSRLEVSDGPCYYAVTNWHVACRDGFSVIRIKRPDNTNDTFDTDVFDFGPDEWEFIPGGPDVAVIQIYPDANQWNGPLSVSIGMFVSPHNIAGYGTGWDTPDFLSVGEDVFMLGLFVDHAGLGTHIPCARFGNISMFPNEEAPIMQPNGHERPSFVVDMHSRTGFSGSPVFAFRTFGSDLTTDEHAIEEFSVEPGSEHRGLSESFAIKSGRATIRHRTMFCLLGIHWGQFAEDWPLKGGEIVSEVMPSLITDGAYVRGMSGMTCVAPSWDIKEVLNLPKLRKAREAKAASSKTSAAPIAESIQSDGENQDHKEDFTHLLNAAARKRERED